MRPSQALFNAAKKSSGIKVPVELTPLFLACGVAICSGVYFSYKKFRYDTHLRLGRTSPDLSNLDEVLKAHAESENK